MDDLVERTAVMFGEPSAAARALLDRPIRSWELGLGVKRDASTVRAIVGAHTDTDLDLAQLEREERGTKLRLVRDGASALDKISRLGRAVALTKREREGYEAMLLIFARPAILVERGRFASPPLLWSELELYRDVIESVLPSVGRLEVTGDSLHRTYVGSGFMIAPGVVMTNRHVALEFAEVSGNGAMAFKTGVTARIDWVEEWQATSSAESPVVEVLTIHNSLDLALLRVDGSAVPLPQPLRAAATAPSSSANPVAVIGYPAWDPRRNEPSVIQHLFRGVYDVKRLQPGYIIAEDRDRKLFGHDCSTLGGNSGSCVIDVRTGIVIGLHYEGSYLRTNVAISLWQIQDEQAISSLPIMFTDF